MYMMYYISLRYYHNIINYCVSSKYHQSYCSVTDMIEISRSRGRGLSLVYTDMEETEKVTDIEIDIDNDMSGLGGVAL